MTENFCMNCEAFNSLKGHDYSGGPGVTVCGECGRKNTIFEVPEGKRDFVRQANTIMGQVFTRLMTEIKQGRLTFSEAREIVENANQENFDPVLDYSRAEENFFELLEDYRQLKKTEEILESQPEPDVDDDELFR